MYWVVHQNTCPLFHTTWSKPSDFGWTLQLHLSHLMTDDSHHNVPTPNWCDSSRGNAAVRLIRTWGSMSSIEEFVYWLATSTQAMIGGKWLCWWKLPQHYWRGHVAAKARLELSKGIGEQTDGRHVVLDRTTKLFVVSFERGASGFNSDGVSTLLFMVRGGSNWGRGDYINERDEDPYVVLEEKKSFGILVWRGRWIWRMRWFSIWGDIANSSFLACISISIWFTAYKKDGCLSKKNFLSEEMFALEDGSTY